MIVFRTIRWGKRPFRTTKLIYETWQHYLTLKTLEHLRICSVALNLTSPKPFSLHDISKHLQQLNLTFDWKFFINKYHLLNHSIRKFILISFLVVLFFYYLNKLQRILHILHFISVLVLNGIIVRQIFQKHE